MIYIELYIWSWAHTAHDCLSYQVIRLNLQKACHHVFFNFHYHTEVVEIAVVCRCEYRYKLSSGEKFVTIFLDLVCSAYEIDVIFLVEILHDNFSEGIWHTSVVFAPVNHIFFGVCRIAPQQVAEKSTVRHVSRSQNLVYLLEIIELWRQPSVDAENLVIDDGSYWEAVKALYEFLPQLQRVSSFALIVKSIDSIYWTTLVISSQKEKVFRVFDFICK